MCLPTQLTENTIPAIKTKGLNAIEKLFSKFTLPSKNAKESMWFEIFIVVSIDFIDVLIGVVYIYLLGTRLIQAERHSHFSLSFPFALPQEIL